MQASLRQKDNAMTKKLQSLLEMAIVIGGLAGAPIAVLASLAPIAATVSSEHAAVSVAQNLSAPHLHTIGLRF